MKAADLYVKSDALVGVEAILAGLDKKLGAGKPTAAAIRTKELAHRIATEPADSMAFDIAPGVLDPRKVIEAIDAVVPKDWDIVVGGGHQAYFNAQMRGRPAERYTTVREFGAVGNGLSLCARRCGGAPAGPRRQDRAVRRRRRAPVPYPGARDAQASGISHPDLRDERRRIRLGVSQAARRRHRRSAWAVFGRPAFENIARGFGLRGHEIRDVSVIPKLFADFAAQGESEIWNIQISDQVTAPVMRQTIKRGHGNM